MLTTNLSRLTFLIIGYLILVSTSRLVTKSAIAYIKTGIDDSLSNTTRRGKVIGVCENTLILIFVWIEAYTALAVIFAAKGIVDREFEHKKEPDLILVGTIVNFTYSILFSIFLVKLILGFGCYGSC